MSTDGPADGRLGDRADRRVEERAGERADRRVEERAEGRAGDRGTLVLVATPIGNLGDLPPRAVEALRAADAIACEDTRRTGRLLQHAGVTRSGPLIVANEHTEAAAAAAVVRLLADARRVVLVTDAGTPGISDPAERIVRAAVAAGHEVTTVPGPVAAVAALVVSGLATDRFVVEGFVPRSGPERARRLAEVAAERRTVVLYEAPHRLARTLADLATACGPDRPVVLARELTKLHEEVWRGTLGDAVARCAEDAPRGEHVVVLAGAPDAPPATEDDVRAALVAALADGLSVRDASAAVADALGVPRRQVYQQAIGLHRPGPPGPPHPGAPPGT